MPAPLPPLNGLPVTAPAQNLPRFELDEEQVDPRPGGGLYSTTVSLGNEERLDGYVVVSTITAPGGGICLETVEARQLVEGGLAHVQVGTYLASYTSSPCVSM